MTKASRFVPQDSARRRIGIARWDTGDRPTRSVLSADFARSNDSDDSLRLAVGTSGDCLADTATCAALHPAQLDQDRLVVGRLGVGLHVAGPRTERCLPAR